MQAAEKPASSDENPLWYKDAVIYQTHVRAFYDRDGDGIGDFRGLTEKLDYIQDLGVTAVWLLPFYPSPLKDDGYDIADYTQVNPIYGTLSDFKTFLKEAHERGLKVITELVLNHTSDQHEWFQKARAAKPGSKARAFYVWDDDADRYKDARIIFQDFEASNWTWDPVAGAHFWHRFYSHQPDLNFDNPEVHRATLRALDFWFKLGVDGLRLDAIPYLYEREGTSCENLPETHAYLKKLRAHVDKRFSNRMLLAEANQWPEDAVAYFGEGDECHMAFHFPVMPRLFMSVQSEDRYPIIDILQQTPAIPDNCQWTIFLRNHDELTLEMVTDEERDYMYRVYARDPRARVNLGIRRRLAPLLGNNRRKIELMNGLLLSLPGTPVIYYGDEIGMGDNIYLGDRDSVRTPMQWSADRNAGFSHANPQKLYLPAVTDPEFHYTAVNVDNQQNSPHSLLWWTKRLIGLRKRHRAFGRGSLEFLTPDNSKVLAFLRALDDEVILVVANLSRFMQAASLDLSGYIGRVPVELFGSVKLPVIEDRVYTLTLGPHSFYWISLGASRAAVATESVRVPTCRVGDDWRQVFQGRAQAALESSLGEFFLKQGWFSGARGINSVEIQDVLSLNGLEADSLAILVVKVIHLDGEPDNYLVPVMHASGAEAERVKVELPGAMVMALESPRPEVSGLLVNGTRMPAFWTALKTIIDRRRRIKGRHGELIGSHSKSYRRQRSADTSRAEPAIAKVGRRNSGALLGEQHIVKLFRRLDSGVNPELEVARVIDLRSLNVQTPAFAGAVEYQSGRGPRTTLAIMHEFKPGAVDGWKYTLDELGRYFERVLTEFSATPAEALAWPREPLLDAIAHDPPELAVQAIGAYLHSAELIGKRTGELHRALATLSDLPDFKPERFTIFYQRGLSEAMRNLGRKTLQLLRKRIGELPDDGGREEARQLLALDSQIAAAFGRLGAKKINAARMRCHGDYDLKEVLSTEGDFSIIDFEGDPARSITERRIKRSPLRDVASMLRSFHQASEAVLLYNVRGLEIRNEDRARFEPWARYWFHWTSAAFLKSYVTSAHDGRFLPDEPAALGVLLEAYVLENLLQDLDRQLRDHPEWARAPMRGILELLA